MAVVVLAKIVVVIVRLIVGVVVRGRWLVSTLGFGDERIVFVIDIQVIALGRFASFGTATLRSASFGALTAFACTATTAAASTTAAPAATARLFAFAGFALATFAFAHFFDRGQVVGQIVVEIVANRQFQLVVIVVFHPLVRTILGVALMPLAPLAAATITGFGVARSSFAAALRASTTASASAATAPRLAFTLFAAALRPLRLLGRDFGSLDDDFFLHDGFVDLVVEVACGWSRRRLRRTRRLRSTWRWL